MGCQSCGWRRCWQWHKFAGRACGHSPPKPHSFWAYVSGHPHVNNSDKEHLGPHGMALVSSEEETQIISDKGRFSHFQNTDIVIINHLDCLVHGDVNRSASRSNLRNSHLHCRVNGHPAATPAFSPDPCHQTQRGPAPVHHLECLNRTTNRFSRSCCT